MSYMLLFTVLNFVTYVFHVDRSLTIENIVDLLEQADDGGDGDEDIFDDEEGGFSNAFCKLHAAAKPDVDPVASVTDAKKTFATELSVLGSQAPGRYAPQLQAVQPERAATVAGYLQKYGVAMQ